jgi:hypothetical protein
MRLFQTMGVAAVFFLGVVASGRQLHAQEPKYATWSQVEAAPETRQFLQSMKDGGTLDAQATAYLEETVFPQLALPANRDTLADVRGRIRTRVLGSFANEDVQNAGNALVATAMGRLAADANADMAVRVNAVLLIGELEAKSGGLWPGAVDPLAQIAADASSPLPQRIAAMVGITDQLSRASKRSDPAILADLLVRVQPAMMAALEVPEGLSDRDNAAAEWLAAQVVRLLPAILPQAPASVAEKLVAILGDQARGLDLRVRAASSLGQTATAESAVDIAAAVEAVKSLAIDALASDVALADERRFERDILRGGGFGMAGMAGMGPGGMMMGPGGMGPGGMLGPSGPEEEGQDREAGGEDEASEERTQSGRGGRPGQRNQGRGAAGRPGGAMGSSMMGSGMMGPGGMGSGMMMGSGMGSSMGSGMMGSGMMMGPGMMGPGAGGFGPRRPQPPLLEESICLRTAWRLQELAKALADAEPPQKGLAVLAEADQQPAILELATQLRERSAAVLDKPTDRSVREALAVVAPELAQPPDAEPENDDEAETEDSPRPVDDVFGDSSNSRSGSGRPPESPDDAAESAPDGNAPADAGSDTPQGDGSFDPFGGGGN